MKLIDKYLLRSFSTPLTYCLLAFVLLYVVFDLFNNMTDFIEARTPLALVAVFYLYSIPSVLIYIIPTSLLLSALYSLSGLTRSNEITAMRASGISMFRLMIPFISVGLFFSILVAVVHETVGPQSAYWTYKFVRSQSNKGKVSVHVAEMLGFVNERNQRDWIIAKFDTQLMEMRDVTVVQKKPDGSTEKIQATIGSWLDGRWWFREVVTQNYDAEGNPRGRVQFEPRREMVDLQETPADFINEIKDPLENPEYVSAREIVKFIDTHRLSPEAYARLRVNLQSRLATPWASLIVTLLGIPFGAQTGRKGAFVGVVSAVSMLFSFYFFVNVAIAMGKKGVLDPWTAGWVPYIAYFCIGCVLVYRMR